jgi:hypothetical protein
MGKTIKERDMVETFRNVQTACMGTECKACPLNSDKPACAFIGMKADLEKLLWRMRCPV